MAGFGFGFWVGSVLGRALGGAIHPLGTGLVALGWGDVLRGRPHAWRRWLARFGLAAGMHALWNGGSLLGLTLAGARFFGQLPPEIDVLGLSAAGATLAVLVILGVVALWPGGSVGEGGTPARPGAGGVWPRRRLREAVRQGPAGADTGRLRGGRRRLAATGSRTRGAAGAAADGGAGP